VIILLVAMIVIVNAMPQESQLLYDSANKRDPFTPYLTSDGQLINIQQEGEDIKLNLEGIIYDKQGQSMAIINGEVLKKDDKIGNIQLIEIKRDSIVYSKDGEVFTLYSKKEVE
jgi:hypothetical protein